jgi:hypothetical protein
VKVFCSLTLICFALLDLLFNPFFDFGADQHHPPAEFNMRKMLGPGLTLTECVWMKSACQLCGVLETD